MMEREHPEFEVDSKAPSTHVVGRLGEITEENLNRIVLRVAWPAVAEHLLHSLVFAVDRWMVSFLGAAALAASAVSGTIIWRSTWTLACIQVGTAAVVARRMGGRQYEQASRAAAQSLQLGALIGLVLAVGGFFGAPLALAKMGASEELLEIGVPYLRVILSASLFQLLAFAGFSTLRASGDTRTPMLITLGMNTVNILLNWLLIFGIGPFPRLELYGAGIATALSIVLASLAVLFWLVSPRSAVRIRIAHVMRFNFTLTRQIVKTSLPNGGEEVMLSVGFVAFMMMVTALGTRAIAAHATAVAIESFSFMIGAGFAVAAATLVGQCLGQEDPLLASKAFHRTGFWAAMMMGFIGLFFLIFPRQLVGLYHPEPEVLTMAVICLRIAAIEQPLMALAMAYSGGLRGAGDTLSPMLVGLLGNTLTRIVVIWYLGFRLDLGLTGIWLGTAVDWAFRWSLVWGFYRWGRWRRIAL
jgi:putative MATE family efflux protein